MVVIPAIDLIGGSAVRLLRGNYDKVTVYNDDPTVVAKEFKKSGASYIHIVDLEGAKYGGTPNIETVKRIINSADLKAEVGGGVRSLDVVNTYLEAGVSRVILGTAAVTHTDFLKQAVKNFGDRVVVGVDIKDGYTAISGWIQKTQLPYLEFCKHLQDIGVKSIICTDISKDGAMQGPNFALYEELNKKLDMNVIASGGVSSLDDIKRLKDTGLYGAIIGKAYYTGAVDLSKAVKEAMTP